MTIRPLFLKGKTQYQVTQRVRNQEVHKNIEVPGLESFIKENLPFFRQLVLFTVEADFHLQVSKKGKLTLKQAAPTKERETQEHNRQKKYPFQEGKPYPFLVALGVMNQQGKVYPKKQDKFRQINHFIQLIEPFLKEEASIVDFGCGKSYLTFALYDYCCRLFEEVTLQGVDLKEEVIANCQSLSKQLNYSGLSFHCEDINKFQPKKKLNLMIALHACDTATDYAIAKAVEWGCESILVAPCCQHELYNQVEQPMLKPLLEHGILRERFASLVTDAARAKLLECVGYRVSVVEFIDSEHTPKNVLIRAEKKGKKKSSWREYEEFKKGLNISPKLEELLL